MTDPAAWPAWLAELWTLRLGPLEGFARLAAALLVGAVIGLDREWRRRPAGLRTHMLVALASATFTIIAFEIYAHVQEIDASDTADPLRLLEAITAGVAFLAAGTIIREGADVKGVTTGSALWLSGALGMACGQGMYGLAALATVLALVILTLLRGIEQALGAEKSDPPE